MRITATCVLFVMLSVPCMATDGGFISTFFGGSSDDWGFCVASDPSGNIFIAGATKSSDLPALLSSFDGSYAGGSTEATGGDIYIAKFAPDLGTMLAFTYLGGSGDDRVQKMVIDENGDVFIAGWTWSSDFPASPGAYDGTMSGACDGFVARLDNSLSTLIASTLIGGSSNEQIYAIQFDESGTLYCYGGTSSSDFPVTPGTWDQSYGGSTWPHDGGDLFIFTIDNSLTSIGLSTFIGGADTEFARNMTIAGEDIYLTGVTRSTDYPVTTGAFDETYNGEANPWGGDIFVTRIDKGLSTLTGSTFLGGSFDDWGYGIVVNDAGEVYVTGHLTSPDFPTSPGAFDMTFSGGEESFVSKFSADLSTLLASTYLGSNGDDFGADLTLIDDGSILVTGTTAGSTFPVSDGAFDSTHDSDNDGFLTRLSADLSTLIASTFIGNSGKEMIYGTLQGEEGKIYSVGNTTSLLFPVTDGAYDTSFNGQTGYMGDAFLFTIDPMLGVDTSQVATFLSGFGLFRRKAGIVLEWSVNSPAKPDEFRLEAAGGIQYRELEIEMKNEFEFISFDGSAPLDRSGETVIYRLYHSAPDGGWHLIHESEYSPSDTPPASSLINAFPNPFNPSIEISCHIGDSGDISIGIYDSAGRLVADLYSGFREAGEYNIHWNGTDDSGRAVTSGVYFTKFRAGKVSGSRKIILMR